MLRQTLKTLWSAKNGAPSYEVVLDEKKMIALHNFKIKMNAKDAKKNAKVDPNNVKNRFMG